MMVNTAAIDAQIISDIIFPCGVVVFKIAAEAGDGNKKSIKIRGGRSFKKFWLFSILFSKGGCIESS